MDKCAFPMVLMLCGWIQMTGATVPPPTNVTLLCHNMQNTLLWSYEQLAHGLRFRVNVSSTRKPPVSLWVNSPSTSIDLSEFSDPENEYMVQISAVMDSEESEPAPEEGIEYSYFKDSITQVTCYVDLPLVNLTSEDKLLLFSFTHPGLLYRTGHKNSRKRSLTSAALPEFVYHIDIVNEPETHKYHCTENVCQGKLPVHDSEKSYCLKISGEMKKMSVQATKQYCLKPLTRAGINVLAFILPVVLVLVVVVIIGSMVFVKKTRTTSPPPPALLISNWSRPQQEPAPPVNYCPITVVPPSPSSSSSSPCPASPELLIPRQQDTSHSLSSDEAVLRLPLGIEQCDGEAQGALDDGYTDAKHLEEEEEEDDDEEVQSRRSYEPRSCCSD